jgi:transcriptional regulator with XRE-family HTH domain
MSTVSGTTRGQHVREQRRRLGWSQKRLAKEANVSPSFVQNLESDMFKRPQAGHLRDIERALGLLQGSLTGEPMLDSARADRIRRELPADVERTIAMLIGWLMGLPAERRRLEMEFLEDHTMGLR